MRLNTNNRKKQRRRILAGLSILALGLFGLSSLHRMWMDSARLVSIEEMPEAGESCYRPSKGDSNLSRASDNLFSAFQETRVYAQDANTVDITRPPVRDILDTAPIYSSVGIDTQHNEVFLQDSNTWSIRVFSRMDNAKPGAPPTEPRRVISGPKSDVQFNSCVYIDPASGDVYSVENDIGDTIVTFANDATGDPAPKNKLKVTHRAFAMAIDNDNQELFLSVQYPPQVAVYRKGASGDEKPKRLLIGDKTKLSDSHGLAIDTKNKLLFVNNWGNVSDYRIPGSGRFEDPSITVFALNADGDAAPLRVIQGPQTQLDWPGAMSVNPDNGDLYVANDVGQSLLVFHGADKGDVAPARVIKGTRTGLSYPTGVFVDAKNNEVWASNLGSSSATVYPLMANGDVTPLRTIRSAQENKASLRFGKTQALVYDPMREQILVPN
jgi:6-phosphogluconolactonase (cycloisomerase 2 family)